MAERLQPDICVIGAGSGGLSVAAAAAAFGVSVVLIEKDKMGGECLNTGCVPSKALIAAGKRAHALADARAFGVSAGPADVDFPKVHRHVHDVIAAIAPNDSKERFNGLGVRVIAGAARFKDLNTVVVGDGIEIAARRFVIATGSSPALPPIAGLETVPYLTNETVFDLAARPEHLIVIGAGAIGLEGTGSKLKVILAGDGEEAIEGSHLLIATGRRANTDGLALEQAGIARDRNGIVVDKGLKTANPRVYAIGDVAGRGQFTHLANYHAGLVIRNALFRLPVKVNAALVPRVTFTDPEFAHVGLTEAEARARKLTIRLLRWPYHENDRAQAERETMGHIKVVTDGRGKILGATIVGAGAGELITTWTLAISRGLPARALAGIIVPYPTLAEIGKRAAVTYFTPSLTNIWVRRIIALLRRFG